jgi:methionine synthase II (cobalamin-independent)
MNDQSPGVEGVCLVGSIPLQDNQAVFEMAGSVLGEHTRRIPDGETGERSNWIAWQLEVLAGAEQLENSAQEAQGYQSTPQISIKKSYGYADVHLPALGYSSAALASYAVFKAAKAAGKVPAGSRFQVSLPTPLAPIHFYVAAQDQAGLEVVYEAKLMSELEDILDSIPADELAIQWDTAVEFGLLEGVFPTYLEDVEEEIVTRLVRLGNAVPASVELGFHLCYGDSGHKHFVEPTDAAILVNVANRISGSLSRPLNWVHMPVPRSRNDAAYFAPLSDLSLEPVTELYLGLVHMTDGLLGAQARIAEAAKWVKRFGVATECGFGRRPAESIADLMQLHTAVAGPVR